MTSSEIYKACEDGDIDLVKVLIETSTSELKLDLLEPNGDTCLHVASSKGYHDIVQLLLYEYHVDPNVLNIDNQTAYEVACNDSIRKLFNRLRRDKYRFSTNEKIVNPLAVIKNENSSQRRYIDYYPNDSQILTQLYFKVLDQQGDPIRWVINKIRCLFGDDVYEKQLNQWSKFIQNLIDEGFNNCTERDEATALLQEFRKTVNIEYLLQIHTLNSNFCQLIASNPMNTKCFHSPIDTYLDTIENRAYQGESYRGLTMTLEDFHEYQIALNKKGSYIQTNTFCCTSKEQITAEGFADAADTSNDKIKVLFKFQFAQPCQTAICLFENLPHYKSLSKFNEEFEVLICPRTLFSVKDITFDTQFPLISLEHFNTDEDEAEMHQERLKSFIDNVILD